MTPSSRCDACGAPYPQPVGVVAYGFRRALRCAVCERRAHIAEMLDTWERAVTEEIIEQVEGGGGDARSKLERLFRLASSEDGPLTGTTADLAIRDWARREQAG